MDDILIFSRAPKEVMGNLGKLYELKPESVREPDLYLGANIEKVQLPDGRCEWAMTSRTYVKNAVKIVENLLLEDGDETRLKTTVKNPLHQKMAYGAPTKWLCIAPWEEHGQCRCTIDSAGAQPYRTMNYHTDFCTKL